MLDVALPKESREATMCKGFRSTLTEPALQWYINLPSRSIVSFAILSDKFFGARRRGKSKLRDNGGGWAGRATRSYPERIRAPKATRRYPKPSNRAKQSSSRSYGESRALFRSLELEGEARRTLQATGAERRKAQPARIGESKPPRRDAATREKAKGAQTYDVEDSESEPEPDKEAPEGVAKMESPMVAYMEQMFSKRVDAM
ncbi:hypothetical protein F2Q69_00058469 [Brassica cretica]|uniref:Uncharacterized protein n=1 Tax=Brassica cretica TaxID=69181 RepID=A0A8S9RQ78_BRACR|nr:hypothetical protein F2Q69_00058469 [Brassica cretica]